MIPLYYYRSLSTKCKKNHCNRTFLSRLFLKMKWLRHVVFKTQRGPISEVLAYCAVFKINSLLKATSDFIGIILNCSAYPCPALM